MKKYFVISGLALRESNRGTAALGYGAFPFLQEKGFLKDGHILARCRTNSSWLKPSFVVEGRLDSQGLKLKTETFNISRIEKAFYKYFHITIPGSLYRKYLKNIDFVAAINGGDGFSDIYNTATFHMRLEDILLAMHEGIDVIQLPQTLGPFNNESNYKLAKKILMYSKAVYVRDEKYVSELIKMGVRYELCKDLSAYMKPEPWDIKIDTKNAIGINVSGLAYSNTFRTLSGLFTAYPKLIFQLIEYFQKMGKTIYLIPHSYRFGKPEESNDDIVACQEVYCHLNDRTNVVFINKDLTSPQVKYLISRMSFFCGTRMHANYAAIYTGVPVFGLAYSYKFAGAFDANGLNSEKQIAMICNMNDDDTIKIVKKIGDFYASIINEK